MQRVDTATAAASPPTQDAAGTPGYFTKGNPTSGTPATVPGQDWFNSVQEEIMSVFSAAGLTPSKTDSTQLLQAIIDLSRRNSPEPGTMGMIAGSSAPTYWMLCDGAAISRTTYAALFAKIGTTWGVGNGSTTFNVPDLRGRGPIGAGQGSGLTNRALAATGGEEAHTLTTAEMPSHTHTSPFGNSAGGATHYSAAGDNLGSVTTSSTGGGGAHNNMQPFAAVNFIIKT